MKKIDIFLVFLPIWFYLAPGPCCAANAIYSYRFTLGVNGTTRADLSTDIVSLSYEEISGKVEITVNNWGTGGFKYSDGNLLSLGTPVALYNTMGTKSPQKIHEGRITSLAPKFPARESPVLMFIVTGTRPASLSMSNRPIIDGAFGRNLLELYPTHTLMDNFVVIACTGVIVGNPDLQPGALLKITGVGERFSGDYSVNQTTHKFDLSQGYTTRFIASSKALIPFKPLSRDPIPRP